MPVWGRGDATLALGSAPTLPRHTGRGPCFINKYQLFYIHCGQRFNPCSSRLLDVVAFLLAGVQGFF